MPKGPRGFHPSMYSAFPSGIAGMQPINAGADRSALLEHYWTTRFTEMCIARFEWKGLPEEVNVRWLEMNLFYNGLTIYFKDRDTDKFFAMPGAPLGQPNALNEPTAFQVTGVAGFRTRKLLSVTSTQELPTGQKLRVPPQCVPIWANYLRTPEYLGVAVFARRVAELERTLEINSKNFRNTRILMSDMDTKLTDVNIIRGVDEGQDYVHMKSNGRSVQDVLTSLDLGGDPRSLEALAVYRDRVWAHLAMDLGLNNAAQEKKERTQSAEVNANNQQVGNMRDVALNARRIAAAQISALYDCEVSVDYYKTTINEDTETTIPEFEGE